MATVDVGVISDTHGLVRPQAIDALHGVDAILHAGDIGSPEVLQQLGEIAPVHAVRGNVDRDAWAKRLPLRDAVEIGDRLIYVVHDIADLDLDPAAAEIAIVVSGHSHRPGAEQRNGVLYLNPGSAGPRRFRLPVTLARMRISPAAICHEIVELAG
jgi:putative phosphoesterase